MLINASIEASGTGRDSIGAAVSDSLRVWISRRKRLCAPSIIVVEISNPCTMPDCPTRSSNNPNPTDTTVEPDIGDYSTRPDSGSLHRGSNRFTIASIQYPADDSTANPGRSPKLPRNTRHDLLADIHTSIAAS
ncbi:hypothetical protein nbrc107696_34040 [Gordonia spumicola]|uniref:Uncharacterized protein n=1 Tax=Gordonia spumicola TaxID=589161 RepID=A0A7I9VC59_9ACTN|nr:hypothetical protein nbrc107696_34040 [Gordonia spumicola]